MNDHSKFQTAGDSNKKHSVIDSSWLSMNTAHVCLGFQRKSAALHSYILRTCFLRGHRRPDLPDRRLHNGGVAAQVQHQVVYCRESSDNGRRSEDQRTHYTPPHFSRPFQRIYEPQKREERRPWRKVSSNGAIFYYRRSQESAFGRTVLQLITALFSAGTSRGEAVCLLRFSVIQFYGFWSPVA